MIAEIDISNKMKYIQGTGIVYGKGLGKLLFYNKRERLTVEENEYKTEAIEGSRAFSDKDECILFAQSLSLPEICTFSKNIDKIKGIILLSDKVPGFLCAYAKSINIPLLLVNEDISFEYERSEVLLDSERDVLIIAPDIVETDNFALSQTPESIKNPSDTEGLFYVKKITSIYADLVFFEQINKISIENINGVAFLNSDFYTLGYPLTQSEEQLFEIYKRVAEKLEGKEALISTINIKKTLGIDADESGELSLLRKQIRAICRASAYGQLSIVFPLISNSDELQSYMRVFIDVRNELRYECLPFCEDMNIAITIETPAALMSCEVFTEEVNLIIIKSNELLRYSFGGDFNYHMLKNINSDEAKPVLQMLSITDEAVHSKGGRIGIEGCIAQWTILNNEQPYICSDALFISGGMLKTEN